MPLILTARERPRPGFTSSVEDVDACRISGPPPAAAGTDGTWQRLDWDLEQTLTEVRVVFDDDVDEYLNNLHRHRTPFEVMPELVRAYRVQAPAPDGTWRTLVSEAANRRRHRVHRLGAPVATRALRLVVDATHGAPRAHVSALKAYGEAR
ncbi:hypothetical protein [Streptomyces sp. NPDC088727]|uniref:hypothetical protein n=1 Tax=Streptomyces sp. NPDC088727 TaxID=3365875 RepID=UPI00380F3299